MKLLVVEDDANLVSALSRTLGSHYQIDAAQGEREACVQLEISRYHALLIDENLAQGSGLGVIRHVRARNQQTPIIVITSQASKNFAIDCLNLFKVSPLWLAVSR